MLTRLTTTSLRHLAIASCVLTVGACAEVIIEPVTPQTPAKTVKQNQSTTEPSQSAPTGTASPPTTEKPGKEQTDAPLQPAETTVSQPAAGQTTKQTTESDKTADNPQPSQNTGWIVLTGSYYPREIKRAPELGADTLLLARPGTRLQSLGLVDGWYKVMTDQGEGYINPSDVRVE